MAVIQADFTKEIGKIKPMHAVNNGPVGGETNTSTLRKSRTVLEYGRKRFDF